MPDTQHKHPTLTKPYPTDHWELSPREIADILAETEPEPLEKIMRIRSVLGPKGAQKLLNQTLAIETHGGQMAQDGSRRRTVGGVFFALVHTRTRGNSKTTSSTVGNRPQSPARPRPLAPSPSEPWYHSRHRQPPSQRPWQTCPTTYTEETQR